MLDLVLPRHCAVSGRPLLAEETGAVAPEVLREVPVVGPDYCSRCGAPQGDGVGRIKECMACREYTEGFGTREVAAAGAYAGVLKEMCLALKFGGARGVAVPLAAWLALICHERGLADKVDFVVPMPLHVIRFFRRGYNQAALIAQPLAAALGKPMRDSALERREATLRQATLSAAQRRRNVEDAFRSTNLDGQTVLLVDDVMTTGATLAAAARCMKRAGARAVYGAVAARAVPGDDI